MLSQQNSSISCALRFDRHKCDITEFRVYVHVVEAISGAKLTKEKTSGIRTNKRLFLLDE